MVFTYLGTEADILRRMMVRTIRSEERPEFDRLLLEKHPLHNPVLVGQSLRYVAEIDGQWIALLSLSAASLHLKGREKWIGWSPRQRARRLGMIVNNSRFLVLPERQRYPNLASRALALCLRRLSQDWQECWGDPVLLVETFVDESQYRGTCYRACGFSAVGPTRGFARASRDFYQEHGQPKQLYLRELKPGARQLLRQARWPADLARHEAVQAGPCPFQAPALESLLDQFGQRLPDARRGHGLRHRQRFVLGCAAVSTLMGACGYRAFENTCAKLTQRQLRALGCQRDEEGRYAPPSDSTFQRVLKKIDPRVFASIIGAWLLEQEISALARLAVDGKVLRGSGRHDGKPLQLLSAVTHQLRLTLEQIPIDKKSNEIPAFKPLLAQLNLPPGTLITADAMHCQQESARYVTQEIGGDYLFGLKGNQAGVLEKAERLLTQQAFPP
jgi:Domain of unknown function (DUF4338)/DDE_Tnp_1-associated/Transposase DDE domain